jgi:hypothetical protein
VRLPWAYRSISFFATVGILTGRPSLLGKTLPHQPAAASQCIFYLKGLLS